MYDKKQCNNKADIRCGSKRPGAWISHEKLCLRHDLYRAQEWQWRPSKWHPPTIYGQSVMRDKVTWQAMASMRRAVPEKGGSEIDDWVVMVLVVRKWLQVMFRGQRRVIGVGLLARGIFFFLRPWNLFGCSLWFCVGWSGGTDCALFQAPDYLFPGLMTLTTGEGKEA
jgi:hypothetical protein